MSDKSYRVTVKVRNANLLRAIEKSGHKPSVKLCELSGISYAHLNELINMTMTPIDRDGNVKPSVEKLCVFLNKMPSELFDFDQMHNSLNTNKSEFDADVEDVLTIRNNSSDMDRFQLNGLVESALESLTPREEKILRLRFGFDGPSHTLEDLGKVEGVTRERIREIETKALRKLRNENNKHSNMLKDFVE